MEEQNDKSAVRVGIFWGAVGGVVGFIVSLLGSFVGIIAAGIIGFFCGRRAAAADEGKSGTLPALKGALTATPIFVLGAAAGALVTAQQIGTDQLASTLSEILRTDISSREAWNLYLIGTAFAAFVQAVVLIGVATIAGTLATRKRQV